MIEFLKTINWQWRGPLSRAAALLEGKSDLYFYGLCIGQIGIGVIAKVKSEAK